MDLRLVIDKIEKLETLSDGRIYIELTNIDKEEFQCLLDELTTENELENKEIKQLRKERQWLLDFIYEAKGVQNGLIYEMQQALKI